MGLVTEKWSEYQFVRGKGGKRGFLHTGVANALEAEADLANQMGVAFGASHDLDASIGAEQPVIGTPRGPNIYESTVNYVPKGRLVPGGGGDDPLARPIRWLWRSAPRTESMDIDAQDRPIVNAAGQPFQSDFPRTFNGRILIARRWEVNYRSGVAEDFENTVNLSQITIPRVGTFAKGRLSLLSYEPEEEYTSASTDPVPCIYTFEVRAGLKQDTDEIWDGFKFRIRNEGFMGWYQPTDEEGEADGDPVLGDFVTAEGEPVSEPVLLDAAGMPIDETIKVMSTRGATEDPVEWPDGPLDQNIIEETDSGVVFLKYRRCKVINYAPLGLF